MRRLEGMILERRGRYAVVLAADGSFRRLRVPAGAAVGDRVPVPAPGAWRRPLLAALAAATILAALLPAVWWARPAEAVALVSVDFGGGLELAVDPQGRVVAAVATGPADAVLRERLARLRGRPVADAVDEAVRSALAAGLVADREVVVVAVVLQPQGREAATRLERQLAEVRARVEAALGRGRPRPAPVVSGVIPGHRSLPEAARAHGLTVAQVVRRAAAREGVDVAGLLAELARTPHPPGIDRALEAILRHRDGQPGDDGRPPRGKGHRPRGMPEDRADGDRGPGQGAGKPGRGRDAGPEEHGDDRGRGAGPGHGRSADD